MATARPTAIQQPTTQPHTEQTPGTQNILSEDAEIEGLSDTQIFGLAFNYSNGVRGKDVDYIKALKYYKIAAERGNSDAMNNIGIMHESGKGVVQDKYEAVKWFKKAAEAGQTTAQITLGEYYENGYGGLPNDISLAKYWYQKAADKGWGKAKRKLEELNATGANKQDNTDNALNMLGAQFQAITDSQKKQFGIKYGLQIIKLNAGKLEEAGIPQGFVIQRVNDEPINTLKDLQEIVKVTLVSKKKVLYIQGVFPTGKKGYFAVPLQD